jgi:ketosteroid isomerase-like protein
MYKVTGFLLTFVMSCAISQAHTSSYKSIENVSLQSRSFEEIYSASVKAMGGEKALKSVYSIKAIANCSSPRSKYRTEIYSAREDRLLFKQSHDDGKVFIGVVNGTYAWATDAKTGEVSRLDKASAYTMRGHEFQLIPIVLLERYKNPVVEAEEDFAGARCHKVRMVDELGKVCHIFFDKQSKLMAGMVIEHPGKKDKTVRMVFNEWKQVGKIKLPSKVTATDDGDFILNFYDITLNGVDRKIFKIPQSIQAVSELLQLHEQQRTAHFNRDAKLLVSKFADDFINISAGKITRPAREQSLNRFQAYFDRSTFLEWDDISPPVVKVSKDASMAYVIVHKRVRLKAADDKGVPQEVTTVFAWMETYEKQSAKWVLTAIASTNEP